MNNPVVMEVGDTPVEISKAGTRMAARLIKNLGATSVFLGAEDVEADNTNNKLGWELASGEAFPDSVSSGSMYAVSPTGDTNEVMVWRVD